MLEKNKLLWLGKIRDLIVGDIEKVKNGTITQVKYGSDFIDFRDRTRDILPADSDEYIKFNGNYPRVTEWSARIEPYRYILVDNIKLFHLGGSLNTIGKKDFMIQEIESTDVRNERIIQIEQWWVDAKKFE